MWLITTAVSAVGATVLNFVLPKRYKFGFLARLLWGGVIMLAVEHIAHGEIVLYPPFLTKGIHEVLAEMLRIGIPMTLGVVILWLIMVVIANIIEKAKRVKLVGT